MRRSDDRISTAMIPGPASTPPSPPPPAGGVKVTAEQEIRMAALAAAARLMASIELDQPDPAVRDLEQTTVGMADRLADWISDGGYDWLHAGVVPAPSAEQEGGSTRG